MNVAGAEHAVERYYNTVNYEQITDALATLTTGDSADHDPRRPLDPIQAYRDCTDDQHRLLHDALFRRLYLDDRITNHGQRQP